MHAQAPIMRKHDHAQARSCSSTMAEIRQLGKLRRSPRGRLKAGDHPVSARKRRCARLRSRADVQPMRYAPWRRARAHSAGAEFCASSRKCTTLLCAMASRRSFIWCARADGSSSSSCAVAAVVSNAIFSTCSVWVLRNIQKVPAVVNSRRFHARYDLRLMARVSWRAITNVWQIVASLRTDLARLSSERAKLIIASSPAGTAVCWEDSGRLSDGNVGPGEDMGNDLHQMARHRRL